MATAAPAGPSRDPPPVVPPPAVDGAPPSCELVPLELTTAERRLFGTLQRAVADLHLDVTLRVAGGWVRDKLIGGPMPRVDIDIAVDTLTGAAFATALKAWLEAETGETQHSIGVAKRAPERSKHLETARMHVLGLCVDLVALRTETYTHGSRIPVAALGTPQEDALRRDLTINALYYNLRSGGVEDWTGQGVHDIRRRLVRTPLPPRTTLLDDPLRALRAVRFAARLRFTLDGALAGACRHADVHAAFAAKVSRERVSSEVDAIIRAPSVVRGVGLLNELGLLPLVFRVDAVGEEADGDASGPLAGSSVDGTTLPSSQPSAVAPAEFSAASLGALASLEALLARDFAGWASGDAAFSAEDLRLARYAALTLPLVGRKALAHRVDGSDRVSKKRAKSMSATEFVLHEELRMASGEVASVVGVQQAAGAFRQLAAGVHPTGGLALGDDACLGGGDVAEPPPTSSPLTSLQAERLTLGTAVRVAGRHWRLALLTAVVADLPPGKVAATFCDGDDTPTVSLADGAEAVVASHGRVAARIGCLGLGDAWAVRPLVDGRALARVLPRLPRGPLVGEILAQQVRWQLAHPGATVDGCAAWILTHFGEEYA